MTPFTTNQRKQQQQQDQHKERQHRQQTHASETRTHLCGQRQPEHKQKQKHQNEEPTAHSSVNVAELRRTLDACLQWSDLSGPCHTHNIPHNSTTSRSDEPTANDPDEHDAAEDSIEHFVGVAFHCEQHQPAHQSSSPAVAAAPTTRWNTALDILRRLPHTPSNHQARWSQQNDPLGRLLICQLLAKNPPLEIIEEAMDTFPDSLRCNPGAFFTACRDASPDVLAFLIQYESAGCCDSSACPYPWILSDNVSVENAKVIVEACPEGILMPSRYLDDCSPLDYVLMSDEMIQQRTVDVTLWNKFKLFLVVAQCLRTAQRRTPTSASPASHPSGSSQADTAAPTTNAPKSDAPAILHRSKHPMPVLLDLILSRSGEIFGNEQKAQHILWILHQLRWTDEWLFQQQCCDRTNTFPIHHVLLTKCHARGMRGLCAARELVKVILEADPESASKKVCGRFALHMALENGWPCHDLLLAAHPDALNQPDPKSGLFPFQTAALYDWCRGVQPQMDDSSEDSSSIYVDDDMFDEIDDDSDENIVVVDFVGYAGFEADADVDDEDEHLPVTYGADFDMGESWMESDDEDDFDDDSVASNYDDNDHSINDAPVVNANPFGQLDIAFELLRANPQHAFAMRADDRPPMGGTQVGVRS